MKQLKLLSIVALGTLLTFNPAYAETDFNDVPEEEVAQAIMNVLKKNPKIAYDAVVQYRLDQKANKADYKEELTPLEEKVAVVIKENPMIVVGALQLYEQEKQQQELLKTAEKYKEHLDEIYEADISAGNPDGKYVLVEFFDFSCGFCKQMAPKIKKLIENNPDLRVIFKPVTFLSPTSVVAAKAAIAANKQGKFLEMYSHIMSEVRVNEPGLEAFAKDELGLDMERYKEDFASEETKNLLEKISNTADKIGLKSVPTLILNGMPFYAVEENQLQHGIDVLREAQ